jgi:molecular chaperone GrpE
MSDPSPPNEATAEDLTPDDGRPETGDAAPGAEAAGPEDTPVDLETEVAKWREIALRATADLENYRKRMTKEKSDAIRFANADLLRGLLPVLDNFDWGLQAAKAESEESPIFQGMSMVQKQIEEFLANEGVETIDAVGQPFDPNVHDAVAQEENGEIPEGHIISQTRRGYRLKERLLRPAAVVVSKGNPS